MGDMPDDHLLLLSNQKILMGARLLPAKFENPLQVALVDAPLGLEACEHFLCTHCSQKN
jgi:hypothetical protein